MRGVMLAILALFSFLLFFVTMIVGGGFILTTLFPAILLWEAVLIWMGIILALMLSIFLIATSNAYESES